MSYIGNQPSTVEQLSSGKILGRTATGTGPIEEISLDSNLVLSGGTLSSSGLLKVPTGGIIYHTSPTPPAGFLRCNGQEVSQAAYPDLYSAIGDAYSYTRNVYVNGKPHKQQYWENTSQTGNITGWTTGTSLPGALAYSQAIVTNSRVYLLGGFNVSSIFVATVYTAPINADGTLGTWTTGTSLPGALSASQAIVTNSRVYLLGGYNGSNIVATVYTAPINADGTLGTWTTGTSLPGVLSRSQAIVTNSRVYLLGGFNGSSYVATVYTAPINADGTLGAWTTGTSLPVALQESQAIVTNSRVYLLGGYNGSPVATVYTAPINADGTLGAWTTGTSLPVALQESQAIVTNSRVYLLGGYNGSPVATVYTAPINADGTLGTWTTGTSLPGALATSQAIVTNSRVYLLGGYNGSSPVATVYTAPFAGGLNDYLTPHKSYISQSPASGNFYLPFIEPKPTYYGEDVVYAHIKT